MHGIHDDLQRRAFDLAVDVDRVSLHVIRSWINIQDNGEVIIHIYFISTIGERVQTLDDTLFFPIQEILVIEVATLSTQSSVQSLLQRPAINADMDADSSLAGIGIYDVNRSLFTANIDFFIPDDATIILEGTAECITQIDIHIGDQIDKVKVWITVDLFDHSLHNIEGDVVRDSPESHQVFQMTLILQVILAVTGHDFFFQLAILPVIEDTAGARDKESTDVGLIAGQQEQLAGSTSTVEEAEERVLILFFAILLLEFIDEDAARLNDRVDEGYEVGALVGIFDQDHRHVQVIDSTMAYCLGQQGLAGAFVTSQKNPGIGTSTGHIGIEDLVGTWAAITVDLFRHWRRILHLEVISSHRVEHKSVDARIQFVDHVTVGTIEVYGTTGTGKRLRSESLSHFLSFLMASKLVVGFR